MKQSHRHKQCSSQTCWKSPCEFTCEDLGEGIFRCQEVISRLQTWAWCRNRGSLKWVRFSESSSRWLVFRLGPSGELSPSSKPSETPSAQGSDCFYSQIYFMEAFAPRALMTCSQRPRLDALREVPSPDKYGYPLSVALSNAYGKAWAAMVRIGLGWCLFDRCM